MPVLTNASEISQFLCYDSSTGDLRWAVNRYRVRSGDIAGNPHPKGYWAVCVGQRRYLAHRLAWLLQTGAWPDGQIDHINGDRRDNRWANLRMASPMQNTANSRKRATNTSGFKGVSAHPGGRWRATIVVGGRQIWLGVFTDAADAHRAYIVAAERYFGEFARAA